MSFTVDDLIYDPATHQTVRSDGVAVPHVTAVLGAVGVTTDFEELAIQVPHMAATLEMARLRGSAVHADCHAYDDDDLVWQTVDARVRPFLDAWVTVRRDLLLYPLERERRLYHPGLNYTGIMDGVMQRHTTRLLRILLDIKTGDPEDAAAHLQTAAYEAAHAAQHPEQPPIDERWSVWLRPGRRVPYTIINYTAPDRHDQWYDFDKFQACLTVYNEQPARRRKVA